jgi:hypothetical protein
LDKWRHNDHTPDQTTASLALPFVLRGASGRVHVELLRNTDPVRLGHALVAIGFDEERFRGFPVVRASITYSGEGLRAAMGWIQVVRHIAADRLGEVAVDRFPLGPEDSPLYTYGYLPTFFDAPANPDHPDGVWQADHGSSLYRMSFARDALLQLRGSDGAMTLNPEDPRYFL